MALAVLGHERSRAVAPERARLEHVDAARDQAGASTRGAVESLVEAERLRRHGDRDRADRNDHHRRDHRARDAPANRRQRRKPDQQSTEARPRQRQHQSGPQDRQHAHGDQLLSLIAVVQEHGSEQDHHHRQEPAEDVGVEEHRVDREVRMQVVGDDEARIEDDRLGRVLHEPDDREQHGEGDHQLHTSADELPVPVDAAHQREHQRERDVEEHHLLQRLLEVGRVHRLDPVQHHVQREQSLDPRTEPAALGRRRTAPLPVAVAIAPARWRQRRVRQTPLVLAQRGHDERKRSSCDDDVKRHQQVRRRPARLNRNPERNREHHERRQQPRPPGDRHRDRGDDGQPPAARQRARTTGGDARSCSCGECQMSASSSTGASTSAPSIAPALARSLPASSATATSAAATTTPSFGSGPDRAANAVTPGIILYPVAGCPVQSAA